MIDAHVPKGLLNTQTWFGKVIAQPLEPSQHLPKASPLYENIEDEARKYIAPSHALKSHERLEIYHQQYWWRLLKCLQDSFPFVTRLFGYTHFNRQIGIPYLSKHPPKHWALCQLGETLPDWIRSEYKKNDQDLVFNAAAIDWATQRAFWAELFPPLSMPSEKLLSQKLVLQPHVYLFELKQDLFAFRESFLKEKVDYWNDHPFPEVKQGACYFVLYRSPDNFVAWDEISYGQHLMLSLLTEGSTIEEACEHLENEGGEILTEAEAQMPFWFKRWTALNFLALV